MPRTKTSSKPKIKLADFTPPKPTPDRILKYQYTSLDGNSNKWYDYQIYDMPAGMHVVARYGRVGDNGNVTDYGILDQKELDSMIRERTNPQPRGKGYSQVKLHAVAVTSAPHAVDKSTSEGKLTDFIFREAGESISSFLSTTVDQLSKSQIDMGRDRLRILAQELPRWRNTPSFIRRAVAEYYNLIPTKLPRRIDPAQVVADFITPSGFAEQETRLDQLEAAIASYAVTVQGGTQQSALGAIIRKLPALSQESISVCKFCYVAGYTIKEVFAVEIPSERARFKARTIATGPTTLLFHGTRNQYVRHILREGLKVPAHSPNGRSLGNGVYFGNKPGKSVLYLQSHISGAPKMMLVCEVAMGRVKRGGYGPNQGYDSVLSPGGGGYNFDEICIYNPSQITIRYLVTF